MDNVVKPSLALNLNKSYACGKPIKPHSGEQAVSAVSNRAKKSVNILLLKTLVFRGKPLNLQFVFWGDLEWKFGRRKPGQSIVPGNPH